MKTFEQLAESLRGAIAQSVYSVPQSTSNFWLESPDTVVDTAEAVPTGPAALMGLDSLSQLFL